MGLDVPNFRFPIPIACHRARFMAQSIYVMMYELLRDQIDFLEETEMSPISRMSKFVGFFHASWFLKCFLLSSDPVADLEGIHLMK